MRLVFFGTPEFALPSLERLLKGKDEIAAVYTQPDRPAGRGRALVPSPIKRFAVEHYLPVYQPERLRRREAIEQLQALQPDRAVCHLHLCGSMLLSLRKARGSISYP